MTAIAPVQVQDSLACARAQARESARELFRQLVELPDGPERDRTRAALVEMHLPLVRYFARRYAGRGEPLDDLLQAGSIGLVTVSYTHLTLPTILRV